MRTARHIYAPGVVGNGVPLIAANVVVTEAMVRRLQSSGVVALLIDDDASAGIEQTPPISEETRQGALVVLRNSIQTVSRDSTRLSHEQLDEVDAVMAKVITEIAARRNLLVCLSDLNLYGGGAMQRALDICVMGTAIARQYFRAHGWRDFRGNRRDDGIEDRLVKLGTGLLLQDIGMTAVPEHIRDKHGMLTAEERAIVQQHPMLGLELLEGGDLSPLTKVTITQHHERYDGSGYPRGLSGEDLHDHGQIAAIAEAYIALCEERRGGRVAYQPHEAFQMLLNAGGVLFRPDVVEAFSMSVAPYGVGTSLRLSDGRHALVVDNDPEAPLAPRVRVTHDADGVPMAEPLELDLATIELSIDAVTGGLPGDVGVPVH